MIDFRERLQPENLTSNDRFSRFFSFEQEYEQFSPWWRENFNQFLNLHFSIENQRNQFITDRISGLSFDDSYNKIRTDLWGYYLEYIRQEAIIPFTNKIKNGRLVGDFYGDKPIVDLTSEREREGATKAAMIDLENKLLKSSVGVVVLRVSPKGWTGMGYDYTETQWQILYKESEEVIRGLTIRTPAELESIIDFLHKQFGIDYSSLDERERLKAITSLNIIFKPNEQTFDFLPLVELIALISQNRNHHKGNLLEDYHNWQKRDRDFQRYDRLTDLLDFLEKKLMTENLDINQIDQLLAFVLIQMASKEILEKDLTWKGPAYPLINYSEDTYHPPPINFQQVLNYLKTLPGCAGGGEFRSLGTNLYQGPFSSFVIMPFGSVEVSSTENSQNKDRILCVNCPFCHQTVDAEIYDGKIHCPKCGAEADIK